MNSKIKNLVLIVYAIVILFFIVSLIKLSVLPTLYLAIIIGILAIVSFILIKSRSYIIAILLMIVIGYVAFNMAGTLDFFNKISGGEQVQNFYVVVKADSEYEDIKDIEYETIGIMNRGGDAYDEAKTKLQGVVNVTFEECGNYNSIAQALLDEKYQAILINSAYYEMAVEDIEGFNEETTRILDKSTGVEESSDGSKPVNVTQDSFNVYISGIDTSGSISNISRSDVNMIVTVNPKTRNILLTSIPRDYYVKLGTIGEYDKLTHTGLYGINETTSTIEGLFGIDINYYARVNFTTVVNLVDTLGGITVNSDYSFYAGGYSFMAGENYLNGDQALAFARERYSFYEGDNQRVKNQQAVISGIINKITGSSAILTSYNSILNAVENNFQTNLSQKEITSLVKMQLKDMRGWTINQQSVRGSGDMIPVYSIPHMNVYVMHPNYESVEAATQTIKATMSAE